MVRAFAGGHRFHHAPGAGRLIEPGHRQKRQPVRAARTRAHAPAGAAACPATEHGDHHDRYRCHSPGGTGRRTRTSQPAASPAAPGQTATPGLVTSCRSQRRCSSGRDSDACVTAGQTAIVRWILPLRMPLTGARSQAFDSNYVSDLGGAKRARTADLLHAISSHVVWDGGWSQKVSPLRPRRATANRARWCRSCVSGRRLVLRGGDSECVRPRCLVEGPSS
jgi:hypothetical protein